MKTKPTICTLLTLAALAVGNFSCSAITGCATSFHATWAFIQTVGGIKVGDAYPATNKTWTVAVECDVSGLTTITTKPTTMNSALVVKDVRCEVQQHQLRIWVVTCVATGRTNQPHWAKDMKLNGIEPGQYQVMYLNPDGSTVKIRPIELH